ncbi:MAG: phage tail tape measure protein [Planctomycetes bacterium]|nr:phage tail tape measure protein [Planctomycetota bacterium]
MKIRGQTSLTDKTFKGLGRTIGRFAGAAVIAKGLANAGKKLIEFEEAASNLSAITGAVGDDLDLLKRKAVQMSGATTKSAVAALEGMKLIASAKPELLENASALAAVTKEAITLSEASGLELPAAATHLATALNQFELSASESSRVINVLAAGAKFAAAEIPDLAASLGEFGGVSKSLNISLEQSAAAVEAISGKIKGTRAGIQLRNVFLKMAASADQNLNPAVVGLSTALDNLAPIQDDVTKLGELFGVENIIAAQTLIKERDRVDELTESLTGTGVAYTQAAVNTDNLRGDLDRLGKKWDQVILGFQDGEAPITQMFRNVVQWVSRFVEGLAELNKSIKTLKAEAMEQVILEAGERDVTEFQDFLVAVKADMKDIENLRDRAGRFLQVDVDRISMMAKREDELTEHEKRKLALLRRRVSAIKEYVNELDTARQKELGVRALPAGVAVSPKVKKQITTITGAAPKTFNINIQSLIETQEIHTTNLTESASEVKKAITRAMAEALADVEPITE